LAASSSPMIPFSFTCTLAPRVLPSFPTRRSSDLVASGQESLAQSVERLLGEQGRSRHGCHRKTRRLCDAVVVCLCHACTVSEIASGCRVLAPAGRRSS